MASVREFLTRFRPASAPGRAAPGGVPADRSAELRAELEPPLAQLDQAEAEARAVRERAEAAAAAHLRDVQQWADAVVAAAHKEAGRVRARTARQVLRTAEAEAQALLADAEREAAAVRERARSRMPPLADRVVTRVLADAASEETPTPEPPERRSAPDGGNSPGSGR